MPFHLARSFGFVFLEKHSIVTELQPVSRNPLIRLLSSLGRDSSSFNELAKVHLKPLVDVVCSSAPGTTPPSARVQPQPPVMGLTRNARRCHCGVRNSPILKAQWCHAFWDGRYLEAWGRHSSSVSRFSESDVRDQEFMSLTFCASVQFHSHGDMWLPGLHVKSYTASNDRFSKNVAFREKPLCVPDYFL